ncbi:hypothetical protein [Dyella sp. 2RAB6]|uniref:hypothetical protein n=1 Tax=Dyella sp. 2RAB6 TaxID=3232992 RepID=UPI003F93AEA9
MNTLEEVKKNIDMRLRAQSVELQETVQKAAQCIVHLMEQGCTIQQLTVRPDYAVIDIDQPGEWLKGSILLSRINGRYRELVRVTKVRGCQVQWIEREAHPLLQREG